MMSIEKIEQYVADLLEVGGITGEGDEQRVRTLLHHLYCAVAMYEGLTGDERDLVAGMQKKFRYFFESDCKLKERKRKQKKESPSPAPLPKEKENKEKDEKNIYKASRGFSDVSSIVEAKKEAFRKECYEYGAGYDKDLLELFIDHWSEASGKNGKLLWEFEKTWETKNRIKCWMSNPLTADTAAAKIRLERTKGKGVQQDTAAKQQQVAAEVRRQQEAIEAKKDEEMKANRISIEEYIRQNPDSMMAKMYRETHKK